MSIYTYKFRMLNEIKNRLVNIAKLVHNHIYPNTQYKGFLESKIIYCQKLIKY